ncbi:MAG: serine protease [Pseudomonadota bacterium]
MGYLRWVLCIFAIFVAPLSAFAQSPVWVQVEARPTLNQAQERARAYDAQLDNVVGFTTGGRWNVIALGPYAPADAEALLRQLTNARQIPSDSYIVDGSRFRQQFWPVGVGAPTTAQPLPNGEAVVGLIAPPTPVEPVIAVPKEIPDETVGEARSSEAQLLRDERQLLQTALKWAGFYNSAIDGAFGRGTRRAMGDWQVANNYEPTGVLTTKQRKMLIDSYNAVLDGMDLQMVRDDATGVEILVPSGVVAFREYEPPFARFDPKGTLQAQVLLISQEGDQDRLFGLYEIMQTLAIVPPEGPRSRRNASFEIEGFDGKIHSYTTATLQNGQIKGFTLVWPTGDDERRRRVLSEMQASFNTVPGVLDPGIALPDDSQAIDLISGLQVRKPQVSRSGFFIDANGAVLTSTDVLGECSRLTIDGDYAAEVGHVDLNLGLAVVLPVAPLAPSAVAQFQTGVPRLQSEVAVAGYPYGGVLTTPSLTFGTLADIRGLNGETDVKRLALVAQDGDAGGPVFDNGGAVLGMLLPRKGGNGQQLPAEVNFSVAAAEIVGSLNAAGIATQTTDTVAYLPAQSLSQRASDMTVLVSCW